MASDELPVDSVEPPATVHKRTYQACIPCRRRKVRCDLGSVDAPHDPPCVRCRREKKDCFFTETRRKRKVGDDETEELSEVYVARNRRTQFDSSGFQGDDQGDSPGGQRGDVTHRAYSEGHSVDDTSRAGGKPPHLMLLSPSGESSSRGNNGVRSASRRDDKASESREVKNETAAALFQSPIHNPGDALHLLVHAVSDLERRNGKDNSAMPEHNRKRSPTLQNQVHNSSRRILVSPAIDPAITAIASGESHTDDSALKDALQAWSRLRFVRAGWFTAKEAISFIDYFYRHLAPLTPICPPDFSSTASHPKLLNEEPMLTVTLLTIATRYKRLAGPGGQSRSFVIHDKLWSYLQGMISRMFWGQEQFGGGFCGAGASQTPGEIEARKRGLRSLGTVESLLLLIDWHPRSMHFPPGDDGDDILLPLAESLEESTAPPSAPKNPNAGWTEPALRSDKMSWSLVGFAYTLSYELGIFDSMFEYDSWTPEPQTRTLYSSERASRIGRLLHIYVSQTCGRLGYPNMLPSQGNAINVNYLKMDVPPGPYPGPYNPPDASEKVQRAWAELTALMSQSNAEIFASKQMTHDRIQTGTYLRFLESYWPRLREWLQRFESVDVPPQSRTMLMIEYEYTRTYINSLSLQAVLEQCATTDGNTPSNPPPGVTDPGQTAPALLSSKMVGLYKENAVYIAEVVDASRNLLRHVIEGLVPYNGLKHAPVRIHFRILSGAMFLLKTFALGAKESEVSISMSLLDATVKALRTNVVDDVHLCLPIADLLSGLTSSIRHKFVRLAIGRKSNKEKHPSHPGGNRTLNPHRPLSTAFTKTLPSPINSRAGGQRNRQSISDVYESLPRTQGPLAGIATPLVDPNDSSITIMPPPDYIYQPSTAFTIDTPGPFSQSQHSPLDSFSPYIPLSNPLAPQQQQQQSPQQAPTHQQYPFSPSMSTGSGGYDWLALDVNPLLNPAQNSGNGGGFGANLWSGAFGPEIGDSLEMLEVLADGYGYPGEGGDSADGGMAW